MYGKLSHVRPAGAPQHRGRRARWVVPTSLALVAASVLGAAETQAATTLVGKSKSRNEATHEQVLEHRFGGDFVQVGNNFTNGSVTVSRVDDSADTSYSGSITSARVIGSFARKTQCFGFFDSKGELQAMAEANSPGFDVAGDSEASGESGGLRTAALAASPAADGPITFGRAGGKLTFSADPSANADGRDHLITYKVSGAGVDAQTMLLFWEDASGMRADFDFNDLIIEVTGEPLLIPLPAAAWMGLSGLAAVFATTGYKRMRRRTA